MLTATVLSRWAWNWVFEIIHRHTSNQSKYIRIVVCIRLIFNWMKFQCCRSFVVYCVLIDHDWRRNDERMSRQTEDDEEKYIWNKKKLVDIHIYTLLHALTCWCWYTRINTKPKQVCCFFFGSLAGSRRHFNFCRILIIILVAPRGVFWACLVSSPPSPFVWHENTTYTLNVRIS